MKKIVAATLENQIFRFLCTGGTSFVLNISIFILLTHLSVWYLFASFISFTISVLFSFVLQRNWTFKRDLKNKKALNELILCYGISVVNIGINSIIVYLSVEVFNVLPVLAAILASAIIASCSFFLYKKIIFA